MRKTRPFRNSWRVLDFGIGFKMRIGDLNKYITIQAPSKVSDSMGGFTETWNDVDQVWAAIWPVSAKEQIQSGQMTMAVTMRIRIRYRSVFRPNWRIKYGNRYFSIVSIVNPNEKNEYLDLLCKEAA